jgi:outer membrane receptor for ferric coprogen and ferric-rhodotorulic acid
MPRFLNTRNFLTATFSVAAIFAADAPPPAETVKLNPFVVSENDAVGYSAASTLAGTRINTALRDVGAAISIITPEFL